MTRNKLYLLFGSLLSGSYAYVIWAYSSIHNHTNITLCPYKNITGIACPSCGSTRSVLLISEGKFAEAGLVNPLGYIIVLFMAIIPFWLLFDIILKKDSLYKNYRHAENSLRNKWLAASLIILVCANWIWNIYKEL